MKRIVCLSGIFLLTSCAPSVVVDTPPTAAPPAPSASSVSSVSSFRPVSPSSPTPSVPPSLLISTIPFLVQAPFRNWDALHEETCEEASLLMVQRYLTGAGPMSEEELETELQRIVAWQTERGMPWDIGVEDLLKTAREFYGLDGRIEENPTEKRIAELLSQGYPVIVPAAGRRLGNPYFSGEGPWYHMLVAIGFDENEFITHDPGTRRGERYRYASDVFLDAMHDWTGVKEEIERGPKRALVLWK